MESYHLQYKVGVGSWSDWLTTTNLTEADFIREVGQSYAFRVQAMDRVGNLSGWVGTVTTTYIGDYFEWTGSIPSASPQTTRG